MKQINYWRGGVGAGGVGENEKNGIKNQVSNEYDMIIDLYRCLGKFPSCWRWRGFFGRFWFCKHNTTGCGGGSGGTLVGVKKSKREKEKKTNAKEKHMFLLTVVEASIH